MKRSGMTLLEVVVAVGLLSLVAVALFGWLRLMGRGERAASAAVTRHTEERLALRLLLDDLTIARGRWACEDGVLRVLTMNRLPNEPAGLSAVRWWWDEATRTVRRQGEGRAERIILNAVPRSAFAVDDQQRLWWSIAAESGPDTGSDRRILVSGGWP
jgi:prepilin-type N-terminal cleavage/methylation domain-containing protein